MPSPESKFILCPVETSFFHLAKKWTVNILRDMLRGKKKFSEFLKTNVGLSTRMLAQRLKDLEADGLIFRNVKGTIPVTIEYGLTEKGRSLNEVLYALAMFSHKYHFHEVLGQTSWNTTKSEYSKIVKRELQLN